MNLVLLQPDDFVTGSTSHVVLDGRRATHIREIHRVEPGDELVVGRLDGWVGVGRVTGVATDRISMDVRATGEPPPPLDVTLVLALPRPLVLKRTILAATTMGVKRIVLLGTNRVEKSFWQSRALDADALRDQLFLGLEQARDTILPSIELARRFRPFVEDQLPELLEGRCGIVAHPVAEDRTRISETQPGLVAIGPEGGWIPHEVDRLIEAGLRPVGLGDRILRVETALAVLLGRFA